MGAGSAVSSELVSKGVGHHPLHLQRLKGGQRVEREVQVRLDGGCQLGGQKRGVLCHCLREQIRLGKGDKNEGNCHLLTRSWTLKAVVTTVIFWLPRMFLELAV